MRALAVAAVATLALGACGQPAASSGGAPPAARPAALSDRTVCLDLQPPSTDTTDPGTVLGASMPAGFAECSTATEAVPGDGEWLVRQERHADVDTAPLAAALRLPDEPPPKGSLACALYLDLSPEVYAVDAADSATRVRWPRDACHHLRPEAKAADKALRWRTVGTRKLRRITPQGAIDTGCTSSWKDIPVLEAAEGVHRIQAGTLGSLGVAGSARSCTYRVPEDGSEAVGDFEKGGRLEGGDWRAVLAEVRAAVPAPAGCTTRGKRFVVVGTDRGEPFYVELDGCRRLLLPEGGPRTATARLVHLLGG